MALADGPTISEAGERGLLRPIMKAFRARRGRGILIGPGDDAAAVRVPKGKVLVVSQDDLAECTHFERGWADPRRVAGRLLAINLSDLAAMGDVRPLGCVISAGLPPDLPKAWFERFLAGMRRASDRHGCPVLGGNLSRSVRIFLTLCVFGAAAPRRLVRRSGARPGDVLAGVGPLGEAAAGLDLVRARTAVPAWGRALARRFWEPEPRLGAGRELAGVATSLMDNSDGLERSAEILAAESRVRLRLSLEEAPASRALRRWCRERRRAVRPHQYQSGEDYGLVFTAPPRAWMRIRRRLPGAYKLGEVLRGRGVRADGLERIGRLARFEHFA
ncbi:MAG: thiamine-phosphate kinase [Elusimicrobiota bacterium]